MAFLPMNIKEVKARGWDERTGMDEPLVHQLSRQWHSWAAMFGSDKR